MRVGLIVYGSLDTVSGGYLYDRHLVDYLREQGDDVSIISLRQRSYAGKLLDNFDRALIERLVTGRYDILLQDELNHPSLWLLNATLRRRSQSRLVSIVHHLRISERYPSWQQTVYKYVERRYLRTVNACLWNSKTTKQVVTDLVGSPVAGRVVYPAGDRLTAQPVCRAVHYADQPLRLLFVGNLIRRKGVATLLHALCALPDVAWRLDIAGDDEIDRAYVAELKAMLPSKLRSRVSILGAVSDEQLSELYQQSDLLCMLSQYEGFGIVYLEAMAFGLPVLASAYGAAGEFVEDGCNGFLIPPDDVGLAMRRIRELATDRQRLAAMSLAAQHRFNHHPTWQQSMASARDYLVSLL